MHTLMRARREDVVLLAGRVKTDGSAVPSTAAADIVGLDGVVITRTGVGAYRATIKSDGTRKYPRILYAKPEILVATDDVKAKLVAIDTTNGLVDFEVISGVAAADVANVELHLLVVVQNTSAGKANGA